MSCEPLEQEDEPAHGALNPWSTFAALYGFVSFPHKERTMNLVGIDLQKKTLSVCVVSQERDILDRKSRRFLWAERVALRSHCNTNES